MATATKTKTSTPPEKEFYFSGKLMIELIRNLIRYDIPILILGKSSIGKSYTIIELAKLYRLPSQVLYVGSEKPEHIEGLPKLSGSAGSEILEYYKPYWFPKAEVISGYVKHGRDLFETVKSSYVNGEFRYTYSVLSKLLEAISSFEWGANQTEAELILEDKDVRAGEANIQLTDPIKVGRAISKDKTAPDDIRDLCVYLSTLLGYGNFWLVLDELDKVEERDIDKYAPLLHIVRERWLKTWTLRDINEGKGIDITKVVTKSDYSKVAEIIEGDIKAGRSTLDTRIIGIANKTKNIEDALFRRFMQVIMEDVMVLKTPSKDLEVIKQCVEKDVQPIEGKALVEGLRVQRIKDVNLQWTYNFFVKITNKNDIEGNFIRKNYLESISEIDIDPSQDPDAFEIAKIDQGKISAIFKILRDNFEGADLQINLFRCISGQLDVRKASAQVTELEMVRNHLVEMSENKFTPQEMRGEIMDNLNSSYPSTAKDKLGELKRWVARGLMYIDATLIDANGKLNQMDVNKLLIPAVQKLFYEKMVLDTTLNIDNITAMMADINSFWERIVGTVSVSKIQVDKEESQKAIFGASVDEIKSVKDSERIKLSENAIMGAGHYVRGESESSQAYKKSLSYKMMMRQTHGLLILIGNLAKQGAINTLKNYPDLMKFIKENHMTTMDEYTDKLIKTKNKDAIKAADDIKNFFK